MSGDEGVVFALPGLGEAGEAAELPQGVKQRLPCLLYTLTLPTT